MANKNIWLAIAFIATIGSLLVAFSAYANGIIPVSGMLVGGHKGSANQDRINEGQIDVSESAVTISIADASLGRFEDSSSMSPSIGKKTKAIL